MAVTGSAPSLSPHPCTGSAWFSRAAAQTRRSPGSSSLAWFGRGNRKPPSGPVCGFSPKKIEERGLPAKLDSTGFRRQARD